MSGWSSGPASRGIMRGSQSGEEIVEESQRRCVLCGEKYKRCKCVCSWCGTKKWRFDGRNWVHHVCAKKKPAAAAEIAVEDQPGNGI